MVRWIYELTLAWWLDRWLQRRANRALLDDVQRKLHFLVSQAEDVKQSRAVQPFDCASVEILWRNLFFYISRGRGEINVSVAPRHARNEQSEIGPTIAALEGRHFSENDIVNDLEDAAALLRSRLDLLNRAFLNRNTHIRGGESSISSMRNRRHCLLKSRRRITYRPEPNLTRPKPTAKDQSRYPWRTYQSPLTHPPKTPASSANRENHPTAPRCARR